MKRNTKKKQEDERILKEMYGDPAEECDAGEDPADHRRETTDEPSTAKGKPGTEIRCPKCGQILESRNIVCPRCSYHGYIPMSEAQSRRLKLILYPIVLAAALVIYFLIRKGG